MRLKRTALAVGALLGVTGLSAGAYYGTRGDAVPQVITEAVSRGTIVSTIDASGTLQAVTTVQVGTQVSGTVQSLNADFNSIVREGQVLLRLDPSLYETEVTQSRANVVRAEADIQRLEIAAGDAETKLRRAEELSKRQLISTADLDAAQIAKRSADAQVQSARAQATQARASLSQAQVNLSKTVITCPIDGIVVSRNVDVGQTVAASLQSPTLFVIAADLRKMQVNATIDESDVGRIRTGQSVSFRVDAYPDHVFRGTVEQVRLSPVVDQNVVTYAAIISASNADLQLKPGMTANVTVEVGRRDDVLRVPAAALRLRPTEVTLEALGQSASAAGKHGVPPSRSSGNRVGSGTVWLYDGGLHPVDVAVGLSDGKYTELAGGVQEGAQVATRIVTEAASGTANPSGRVTPASGNPLLGTAPRRF